MLLRVHLGQRKHRIYEFALLPRRRSFSFQQNPQKFLRPVQMLKHRQFGTADANSPEDTGPYPPPIDRRVDCPFLLKKLVPVENVATRSQVALRGNNHLLGQFRSHQKRCATEQLQLRRRFIELHEKLVEDEHSSDVRPPRKMKSCQGQFLQPAQQLPPHFSSHLPLPDRPHQAVCSNLGEKKISLECVLHSHKGHPHFLNRRVLLRILERRAVSEHQLILWEQLEGGL